MMITLLEETAKQYAAEPALQSPDLRLTYDQLNRFANRLARTLRYGDFQTEGEQLKAGILLSHGALQPAALLGALKAGGLYIPLDPFYPDNRLEYILQNSEATIVLTDTANAEKTRGIAGRLQRPIAVLNIEEPIAALEESNLELPPPEDRFAYILYTSGSTGKPKGVVQTLDNVFYYTRNWIRRFSITHDDRMTFLTSFCHDGAVQDIFSALLAGATLYPLDVKRTDIETGMESWLRDNRITIWHSVPTLFRYFAEGLDGTEPGFDHLRYILLGGEPLRDRDVALVGRLFPKTILANIYGQTESSVNSIFEFRPGDPPGKPVIGEPLSDTDILLVDDEGDVVEGMGVGEIVVACRHLAPGYWRDEELTEEKFGEDDDFGRVYWTGDLGARLGTGAIEMMGRRDFQVKIRGFRVETGDIETALLEHPLLKEAAVTALAPDGGDPFLCAYIVAEDPIEALDTGDLRQFLLSRLPDYMVPSRFVPLAEMPLTANGKVNRNALPVATKEDAGLPLIPPRNHTEQVLADIWSRVLGVPIDSIGIDHDFFQLGGHSLKAVTLSLKIHQELDVKILLPVVFSHATIRRQADFIAKASKSEFRRIPAAPEMASYPAASQQRRLHFLYTMNPGGIAYNLPQILQLQGTIDRRKIEHVFRRLVARHEALRTSFELQDGELRQIIHDTVEFGLEENHPSSEASIESIAGSFIRPFDLSCPPLVRVGVAVQSENLALLLVDLHHIIADGSSLAILVREFIALYGDEPLPEPQLHYKDYACWMRESEQVRSLAEQKLFWLSVYEVEAPLLQLPLDFPRPTIHGFSGERIIFSFDRDFSIRLESLAAALGCTLYVLLLAIYTVFLAKVSGQEDIVVGTPVSGRFHAELHQLVGMFVNTLALRLRPDGRASFASFVETAKIHALDAMNHQLYPFEELVENLHLKNDVSRNPLFDTMFMLQTFMDQEYDIPKATTAGLEAGPVDYRSRRSLFDLSLQGANTPEGLSFTLEYCTALFTQATILRFISFFRQIARQIADDANLRIRNISILPEEDRHLLLHSFNATDHPLPENATVLRLFLRQADMSPHRSAMTASDRHITFDALLLRARTLASRLKAAGAGKETIVAVMLGQSPETASAILGIMLSGAAYLPLGSDEPLARLRFKLKDASARLLVSYRSLLAGELPEVKLVDLEATTPTAPEPILPIQHPAAEDLAYVIYTSGSTGLPKGVMVEHRNLVNEVSWYLDDTRLGSDDRLLLMTSFTFDASIDQLYAALARGAMLDIVSKNLLANGDALLDYIRSRCVTILTFVPGFLRRLLAGDIGSHSVRMVVCGGESLSAEARDIFVSRGIRVRNHYGPTEATIVALAKECTDGEVTLGKPIRNARCYILDQNHRQLPIGVFGEVAIAGAGVSRGYLNRPDMQAETFVSLPHIEAGFVYKTGDTGRVRPDLDVEFGGRNDRQIKFRGYRLELAEIEHAIAAFPGMAAAAVVAREGDDGDPVIRAFVVPGKREEADNGYGETLERLREYLPTALPEYMVPAQLDVLDNLPLTSNGKVDREALRALKPAHEAFVAPSTPMEASIARLFASVLNREEEMIPCNRGFFELGGNSLALLRLKAEILKELAVDVPVLQVFKTPTVRGLASYIAGSGREGENLPEMARLNRGGHAPIFCFPPFTGLGLSYLELTEHMDDYSIYAFDFIEEQDLIGRYANAIDSIQPREPLALIGYSVGGVLALQVAAELERRGRVVAALMLLDCYLPGDAAFGEDIGNRELELLAGMKTAMAELHPGLQPDEALRKARRYLDYFRTATLPSPVRADVYLLLCGAEGDLLSDRGWRRFTAGKIQIFQAKGDHYRMLSEGFAGENARIIDCLLKAMPEM